MYVVANGLTYFKLSFNLIVKGSIFCVRAFVNGKMEQKSASGFYFSDGRWKTGNPAVNRVEVAFGAVSSNVLLTRTEKRFR